MAGADYNILNSFKSIDDYRKANEEFQAKRLLMAAQTSRYMDPRADKSSLPAVIQIANEYQKARDSGDMQRVKDIETFAKVYDKGVASDQYGALSPLPNYANSVSSISGAKSGAEEQAKKDVQLSYNPRILEAENKVKARTEPTIEGNKEKAKVFAKSQADAGTRLSDELASSEIILNSLDKMIGNEKKGIPRHTGFNNAVGVLNSKLPTFRNETADFENLLKQAQGGAFLEAYNKLRGGGAITEQEGVKATQAYARLQTAASKEGFLEAAREFRDIIETGMERARNKASGSGTSSEAFDAGPDNSVAPEAPRSQINPIEALKELKRRGQL